MADISNGSLSFTSTMDNEQMNAAIDETLRRIQGLSDGTVQGTLAMSDSFTATADGARNALTAIGEACAQHEKAIGELSDEYDRLGKKSGEAFMAGRDDEYRAIEEQKTAIQGEIRVREQLLKELRDASNELESEAEAMEESAKSVNAAGVAHESLRAKIRTLKEQMADMVANGIDEQSEAYRALRDELGRLMDIQGDINTQGSVLANDELKIQGVIQGFTGLTAAMSATMGVVTLFGAENETLQKTMAKVNALLAISVSIQQVAQVLNKDSAFMIGTLGGLKQWWAGIVAEATAAETAETVAFGANTAAQGAETVATGANTAAHVANTAARGGTTIATGAQTTAEVANTAAMAGETVAAGANTVANIGLAASFRAVGLAIKSMVASIPVLGWIAVGITAIITAVSALTDEEEEAKDAVDDTTKKLTAQQKVMESVGNTTDNEIARVTILTGIIHSNAASYDQKRRAIEQVKKIIPAYRAELDAEGRVIRENTQAIKDYIAAMEKRAMAAAVEKELEKLSADELKAKLEIRRQEERAERGRQAEENRRAQAARAAADASNPNVAQADAIANNPDVVRVRQQGEMVVSQIIAEGHAAQAAINAQNEIIRGVTEQRAELMSFAEEEGLFDAVLGTPIETPKVVTPNPDLNKQKDEFKEHIRTMRELYNQYNQWANADDEIVRNAAKTEFAAVLDEGATYLDYLKKQRAQIMAINPDERTAEQTRNLATLNQEIAEQTRQTVLESFNKELNAQLANAKTITDMLNIIEQRRQELANDGTDLDNAKSDALNDAEKDIMANAREDYEAMLREYGTFEQKKAQLAMEFAAKRAIAEREGNTELVNALTEAEKEALSKFALDEMMKSPDWELMFGDLDGVSTKKLNELLRKIEGTTGYLGIEFAPEDLAKLKEAIGKMKDEILERNPFKALKTALKDYSKAADEESKKKALTNIFKSASGAADIVTAGIKGIQDCMSALGVEADSEAAVIIGDLAKMGESASQIAQGLATGNPISIIQGSIGMLTAAFDLFNFKDRAAERQIKKHQQALKELSSTYQQLEWAIDKALGGDVYKGQMDAIHNMESQIDHLNASIAAEDSKKKTDHDRIRDWQDEIAQLERNIADMYDEIAKDILQTDAKSFANELGDALADAFSSGEDAAKAFEKTVNNVLKNAIVNQLKKNFLEKQLQGVLDSLEDSMGYWNGDVFHFNGLTDAEIEQFRQRVAAIAETYNKALEQYSDIFKDVMSSPDDDSSLVGAVKGVTEETAEIISGQMQAIRINQAESVALMRDAIQSLARIANNTSYNYHLAKLERIVTLLEGTSTDALRGQGIQI